MFQETGKLRPKRVFVKQFSSASLPQDGFLQAVMKNVKGSGVFYTAVTRKGSEDAVLPSVYVYAQGAFRILNWGAFYGLPGVKPIRIRVGTSVAKRQLLYQVNPTMNEDARKQHAPGTVVLHMVIDSDGNISQLQPVSGPELLVPGALDAVRQWRFRPLLLNGDPVEVDTTVEIIFSLDQ
ncbi:MAG TPA: energy transducer TonB [Candidatus Acidoferrum sp.]|nr:energy transducer TonB [Candidatus Acidoferrum sp.]